MAKAFTLKLPEGGRTTSVIFASPHSGRVYPPAFLAASQLCERVIRSSEDAFVDLLLAGVPDLGAPLLAAEAPRAFVDLNRAAEELDPALIAGIRPSPLNARVASGLGVIPRVVSNGRAIYSGKLTREEAELRLCEVWHPYHATLAALMRENLRLFGEAILIDCHSMPHEAIDAYARAGGPRPDIVLGDRFGSAASASVVALIEAAFTRQGFCVARNAPFSGAYIVQHYGRPMRHQHAVQIEIDRKLYMDEQTVTPHDGFTELKSRLTLVAEEIAAIGRIGSVPLAAE